MGSNKPSSAASAAGGGGGGGGGPSAAVCCMCGDHGLLPELFRCATCSVRSQHTYCTDRYPKADSYGMCNWCLRADQGNPSATSSSPRSNVKAAGRLDGHSNPTSSGGGGGRSVPAKAVAARRDFAAASLNNKPIKKHHQQRLLLRRSASDVGSRVRAGADHDAPPSPGVARGRTRIPRYRLLEEVITSM